MRKVKRKPDESRTEAATRRNRRAVRARRPEARVTVTFRHVDPTEALRVYAQRKLAHVAKLAKRACDVHLILSVDKYRQRGEVTVKSGRLAVTAQEETKDLYSVIDLLVDKVGRQIRRHLEKLSTRRMRTRSTPQILSAVEEPEPF